MNYKDTIKSLLPGWNGRLACHHVGYLGDGHVHRAVPYNPADPKVMAQRISLMQSAGFDILIETWQGPWATACHADAVSNSILCAQMGMQFALLLDPWCAKLSAKGSTAPSTANIIAALEYSSSAAMLAASSYVPEKYILDFNTMGASTPANLAALSKQFPSYKFLQQGAGFSWISIPSGIPPDSPTCNSTAVANLKSQHSNPAMRVASFCASFDDSGMPLPSGVQSQSAFIAAGGNRDFTQSVWGGPARRLYSYSGQFMQQQIATINPNVPIIACVTWSDYDEQSSGPLEKVIAEAAGINWSML